VTVRRIDRTSHALAVAACSGGVDRGVAKQTHRAARRAVLSCVAPFCAALRGAPITGAPRRRHRALIRLFVDRLSTRAWIPAGPGWPSAIALRHGFAAIRPAELFQVVKTG
jgi:hypothetical protein